MADDTLNLLDIHIEALNKLISAKNICIKYFGMENRLTEFVECLIDAPRKEGIDIDTLVKLQ
ncbi:MAG: hypothetical protein ACTSP4_12810 [Candidatus Hodarchaeales archaeon]